MVAAQKHHPGLEFQLEWLPFQLDPHLPADRGANKLEYVRSVYRRKFGYTGGPRRFSQRRLFKAAGKEVSINFRDGGNTGNTFGSHRLIYLGGQQGKQNAFVEELRTGTDDLRYGRTRSVFLLEVILEKLHVVGFWGTVMSDVEFRRHDFVRDVDVRMQIFRAVEVRNLMTLGF